MGSFVKSENLVYHNTKAKVYPDGRQKITVCSKPIFKSEWWEPVNEPMVMESKPKNMTHEVREDNMKRAKERIFDVAVCNDFRWFITWTLDKEKVDRYDSKEISDKLKVFLKHKVQRNNARYLIIPEHHKDGAIHLHGLLAGDFKMVDSGKKTADGRTIYNMPEWTLGFSTAIELDDQRERVSCYITKYVTKEFKKIFGSFYYAGGHGLVRKPPVVLSDVDYSALEELEFHPKGLPLGFKYLKTEV